MFTRRSALTPVVLISQHSLMNSRCALACCCPRLRSSFTHLAGFLKLKRMQCRRCLTHSRRQRTSSSLSVEPVVHQASDRHRAGALDVAHKDATTHNILSHSCRTVLLVARCVSSGRECSG